MYYAREANGSRPSVYVSLEPYNNGIMNYEPHISITGLQKDVWFKYDLDLIGSKELGFANAVSRECILSRELLTN